MFFAVLDTPEVLLYNNLMKVHREPADDIVNCHIPLVRKGRSESFRLNPALVSIIISFLFFPLLPFFLHPAGIQEKQLQTPGMADMIMKVKVLLFTRFCEEKQDNRPLDAVKYGMKALMLLKQIEEDVPSLEIPLLLAMTWAYQNVGEYETALKFGRKAALRALETGDKHAEAMAYNHLGWIYGQMGFLDRSLDYVLRALNLFEQLGDKTNIAEAFKNVGNVYKELKNRKLALKHYLAALSILETLGDKKNISRVMNNIAILYKKSKQLDKALKYYRKTRAVAKQLDWKLGLAVARINIATIYSEKNEAARALRYNKKTLQLCKILGQKRFIAAVLSNIGVNYRKLRQYNKALDHVYRALDIARRIKNKDLIRNFLEELYYIYRAKKDYKQAFNYLKQYKDIHDEIISADTRKNISDLLMQYKIEKKEKEIQRLIENSSIQQLKFERHNLVRNFFIVLSLLVLLLSLVIFNRYRTKKRAERLLKESEKKLRAMNTAKDKLFSIIAHDLESPLNGLILCSRYLEKNGRVLPENVISEFHHQIYENANRMSKLLENLLHWAVSQRGKLEVEPEVLDLNQLSEDAIMLLESSAVEKDIQLVSHVHENSLVWADKRMVETIMRNLVSNAVKYTGKKGEVHIFSRNRGGFLEVEVADTGIGIPEEKMETLFDLNLQKSAAGTAGEKGIGLGLILCKEFVEENGGTIRAENNNGNGSASGTRMVFTLPVALTGRKTG
jgi:signal transduction histidine kinase